MTELALIIAWTYSLRRQLQDKIRADGPIITKRGRLSLESSGYEYPDQLGVEFPGLAEHKVIVNCDTLELAERAMSLLDETLVGPEGERLVTMDHEVKVDGRAAASLAGGNGTAAERIKQLRIPKGGGKLVIR